MLSPEADMRIAMMRRAIHLASLADRRVGANPKVGCVIAHNNRIIGEGYHHVRGEAHAERQAINSVPANLRHLLPDAEMYITLEPCNHHGLTPPCLDAIITHKIKSVHITTIDPNPLMSGRSIEIMRALGMAVHVGSCAVEAEEVNKVFLTNQFKKRSFVSLKWAQDARKMIGSTRERILISGKLSGTFGHKLRSEVDGILIGSGTTLVDDPSLTTRHYQGNSPTRILLDRTGKVPLNSKLLSDEHRTIIYSLTTPPVLADNKEWITLSPDDYHLEYILRDTLCRGIYHILIEGGAQVLSSFIKDQLWDEAYIIQSPITTPSDVKAPMVKGIRKDRWDVGSDMISLVKPE